MTWRRIARADSRVADTRPPESRVADTVCWPDASRDCVRCALQTSDRQNLAKPGETLHAIPRVFGVLAHVCWASRSLSRVQTPQTRPRHPAPRPWSARPQELLARPSEC